jgi:hypothetical protein
MQCQPCWLSPRRGSWANLRRGALGRRITYGWCLFGIADLVVALTNGGNDVPGTSPPLGLRCAEPSHFILSAGDGPYFRGAAGPYAPWPASVAAEAGERLDRPAGRGAIRLPDQRPARGGQVSPSSQPPRDDDMLRLRPFDILKRTIGGSVVTAASAALARPKRFERVTLAFGGQDSTKK